MEAREGVGDVPPKATKMQTKMVNHPYVVTSSVHGTNDREIPPGRPPSLAGCDLLAILTSQSRIRLTYSLSSMILSRS
jgi:hypothetical protein